MPNIGQRTLWGLSSLRNLNLTSNNISHIVDNNFDGLESLKQLVLDRNNISSITSAAFHHLPNLEELNLAHNNLSELAPRIFYKLNNLKKLDLSNNKILIFADKVFEDIRNIQHFICDDCHLRGFRVPFTLQFLRSLSLARNKIRNIEDVEEHLLRTLTSLNLQVLLTVAKTSFYKIDEFLIIINLAGQPVDLVAHPLEPAKVEGAPPW